MLPETKGKTYILRIISVYVDLFRAKYGFVPQIAYSRWGAPIKRLMETHTELQIAAMLVVFFNWRGMASDDEWAEQKLIDAGHNLGWFFSTTNSYEIYLRNVFRLDLDNEEEVKSFVEKNLEALNK